MKCGVKIAGEELGSLRQREARAKHVHSLTPHGLALLFSSPAALQVVKCEGVGEEQHSLSAEREGKRDMPPLSALTC